MKVSIIIPVKNAEDYLDECLSSVLAQTMGDFEALCVDDGSTDRSFEILKSFSARDSRVKVLPQQQGGAGHARNVALEVAQGEYLAFLDADDYYDPAMLEIMTSAADASNLDVVLCKSYFLDDRTKKRSNHDKAVLSKLKPNTVYSADDLWGYAFRYAVGWPWDKLFRRSFVEKHKLTFQELESTNDAYFVYMALALVERFAFVENRLVYHRVHNLRSIQNVRDKTWMNLFRAIEEIRKGLQGNGVYEEAERDFLNWIAEQCVWSLLSLRSSNEAFYDFVQNNYAHDLASYSAEFFYSPDYAWQMALWEKCDFATTVRAFEILEEKNSLAAKCSSQKELAKQYKKALSDNEKIKKSRSYRLGRALTLVPRRLKKAARSYRKGGAR